MAERLTSSTRAAPPPRTKRSSRAPTAPRPSDRARGQPRPLTPGPLPWPPPAALCPGQPEKAAVRPGGQAAPSLPGREEPAVQAKDACQVGAVWTARASVLPGRQVGPRGDRHGTFLPVLHSHEAQGPCSPGPMPPAGSCLTLLTWPSHRHKHGLSGWGNRGRARRALAQPASPEVPRRARPGSGLPGRPSSRWAAPPGPR